LALGQIDHLTSPGALLRCMHGDANNRSDDTQVSAPLGSSTL